MKKLTKILALALAVAMMLGMTSMAANLYYKQDFSAYNDYTALQSAMVANDNVLDVKQQAQELNFAGIKTQGKNMATRLYYSGANFIRLYTNDATGNKFAEGASSDVSFPLYFIPDNEWTANANEAYIIAFNYEVTSGDTSGGYAHLGVIGKTANDTYYLSPVAGFSQNKLYSIYSSFFSDVNGGDGGLYATPGEDLAEGEEKTHEDAPVGAKPFALKFEVNAEGGLKRSAYTSDIHGDYSRFYADSTFQLGDYTGIAGFGLNTRTTFASVGDITVYTMDPNEALTATSAMNGATGVLHTTNKATLTFNQPVALANVAVTAGGNPVNGVTTEVRDVVTNDGKIYSEVDVLFANELSFGTTYSIDVSNVKNDIGVACGSAPVTFTTAAAPEVTLEGFSGLAEGSPINLNGATGTVYVKATVRNSASAAVNGRIVIEIRDAQNNLVKYASATKTLAATNGTATFAASFKLAEGQTVSAVYR